MTKVTCARKKESQVFVCIIVQCEWPVFTNQGGSLTAGLVYAQFAGMENEELIDTRELQIIKQSSSEVIEIEDDGKLVDRDWLSWLVR